MPQCGAQWDRQCPSDVGLKWPCPGSLLCKGGFASTLPQGHCQEQGTPQWETALVTPPCPSRLPHFPAWFLPSNKILKSDFTHSCCQNPSMLQQFPAAQAPAQPQGNDIPAGGLILQTMEPHCPSCWPVPLAPALPGASGKDGCEIMLENADFYVSPAGSLMFSGQCFEATWSVTHSLWHPDGTAGHRVWHFRQKVGITSSQASMVTALTCQAPSVRVTEQRRLLHILALTPGLGRSHLPSPPCSPQHHRRDSLGRILTPSLASPGTESLWLPISSLGN